MRSLIKLFIYVVFISVGAFPIYAFASSDSGLKASGEGAGPISGWTTSNIHYQPSNDPSFIKSVTFDLDAPAGTVSVKLNSDSAVYTSCTNVNGYHWQCDFPTEVRISGMNEFHVVAVSN